MISMMTDVLPRCGVSGDQISPYSSQYKVYIEMTQGAPVAIILSAVRAVFVIAESIA